MGTLCSELAKEGHLSLSLRKSPSSFIIKMVDNVETTTPTIEEVAAPVADNGEAEPAVTEEVKTSENGANGTHEETKEPEVESTNGAADKTEEKEETTKETTEKTTEESTEEKTTEEATEEATKRKADAPSEDETVDKIAKLKETAAEVVAEAEQSLPKEPLTEAEATA